MDVVRYVCNSNQTCIFTMQVIYVIGVIVVFFIWAISHNAYLAGKQKERDNKNLKENEPCEETGILARYENQYVFGVTYDILKQKYVCEYPSGKVKPSDFNTDVSACRIFTELTGTYMYPDNLENHKNPVVVIKGDTGNILVYEVILTKEEYIDIFWPGRSDLYYDEYILIDVDVLMFHKDNLDCLELKTKNGKRVEIKKSNYSVFKLLFTK
jgi:hypothetical protein